MMQQVWENTWNCNSNYYFVFVGAPMKPAARLHLIKQREYFRNCPEGMQRPGMGGSGLNPSWTSPDMGMGGNGDTSYYYGTGIGQPLPDENYGSYSTCHTVVNKIS